MNEKKFRRATGLMSSAVLVASVIAAAAAIPATAGQEKIEVCHKPGTPAEMTKRVAGPALEDHLGHGDNYGACAATDCTYDMAAQPGYDPHGLNVYPSAVVDGQVVCGGPGDDTVSGHVTGGGIFNGGDGDDTVSGNVQWGGIFNGGDGDDTVNRFVVNGSTFNGGKGNDRVAWSVSEATFNGGHGKDRLGNLYSGLYNGGTGKDVLVKYSGPGHCVGVEKVTTGGPCPSP